MKNDKFITNDKSVLILPMISTLIVLCGNIVSNNIVIYFGIMIMFYSITYASTNELLLMIVFYVPNIRMFRPIPEGNTFVGIFILLVLIRYILKYGSKINYKAIFVILVMCIALIINYLICNNWDLLISFIRFACGFLVLSFYIEENGDQLKSLYYNIRNVFLFACIIVILCGFIYNIFLGNYNILYSRFSGVRNDPNYFSLIMAMAFSLCVIDITYSEKKINTIIPIIILFGGGISLSRGFIIAVSINVLVIGYIFFSSKTISLKKKLFILLLLGLIIFIFNDLLYQTLENYITRFSSEDSSGGNGRILIAKEYIDIWKQKISYNLFGIGSASNLYSRGLTSEVHHNYFIELLTTVGIIGSSVMMGFYFILFGSIKNKIKMRKYRFFSFFPLFTLMIGLMGLGALFSDSHLICVFICFLASQIYKKSS